MKSRIEQPRLLLEPRWPAALAVVVVLLVLAFLPGRVRLMPWWSPYVLGLVLLLPMAGVWLSGGTPYWLRLEKAATLVFFSAAQVTTLATLLYLIVKMLHTPEEFSGQQLLMSSAGAWVNNILAFSMLYWRIDRGGPEARAKNLGEKSDWLFPQAAAPQEVPLGWHPTYVDYLFLAFSTATAFSPTDVLPLTPRAKILMMLESLVSLATLVVVASRAINILGN